MTTKYNKKAVLLYHCKQLGKGIPVTRTNAETSGTIAVNAGSTAVTGTGTLFLTEVTPGAYLYTSYGYELGRVASVASDTSLTLYAAMSNSEVDAVPKVSTAKATAVGDSLVSVGQTVTTTAGSTAITFGASVSLATKTALYTAAGVYIGTLASVVSASTSGTLIAGATVTVSAAAGKYRATSGGTFSVGMGNANAIAAYTLNANTEISVENFQYVGDELDRDETTSETDRYFKADFECHLPALGELNVGTSFTTGTGAISPTIVGFGLGTHILGTGTNFTTDGIVAGKRLYTTSGLFIGTVETVVDIDELILEATPTNISAGAAIAFKLNTAVTPTPTDAQIPRRELFEMLGLQPEVGAGYAKVSNSIAGDDYLEVEYHMASADDLTTVKVRSMSDVIGTIDLNLDAIGKKMKVKLSMMGAYNGIFAKPARIPDYGAQKQYLAENLNSDRSNANIVKVALVPYTARTKVTFYSLGVTQVEIGETVTLGGLTFTATAATSKANLVKIWRGISNGTVGSTLASKIIASGVTVADFGNFTGTLSGYSTFYTTPAATSLIVQAIDPTVTMFSTPFGGTALLAVDSTVDTLASTAPALPTSSNICIGKLDITNFAGFSFNRFQMSCGTGWSKVASQGELSVNILEDAAGVDYEPEDFVGIDHRFYIQWGNGKNNTLVAIDIDKVTLQAPASGEIADYKAQDLKFRITGKSSITFS